jgi:protein involved in polysaccharide export with SLBB domain
MANNTGNIMRRTIIYFFIVFVFTSVYAWPQIFNGSEQNSSMLNNINKLNVTIGGDFLVNGSFPAFSSERIDQYITRIYNDSKYEALNSAKDAESQQLLLKKINDYPRRNIVLKRANGTEIIIDLEKFRLTGDFRYNPYLANDDLLIFPAINMDKDFVEIRGAVNKNLKFQFVEGDKLSDALLFAQGIDKSYEGIGEAQISRLDYSGNKEEIITVKITEDAVLQRGDRIRIIGESYNKKNFKVLVLGETNYQGYIYITKDNTSLREVIQKAGGFTERAALEKAELIRNSSPREILRAAGIREKYSENGNLDPQSFIEIEKLQAYERLSMLRMYNLAIEDSSLFSLDNNLRLLNKSGILDFTKVMDDNSEEGNFKIKDGDIILVPEAVNTVFVFGQVKNAGYVQYKEGMDYNYYIAQAGGYGEAAEDEEVQIIGSKSRSWTKAEVNIVNSGDYIYVPKSPKHNFGYSLQTIAYVTSITSGVATIALLIIQLFNNN